MCPAGRLLAAMERANATDNLKRGPALAGQTSGPSEYAEALSGLADKTGTARWIAHRWQQVAAVPDEDFEAHLAETNRKHSEAAKEQPRDGGGFGPKQVTGQNVPRPDSHPGKEAKAARAGVLTSPADRRIRPEKTDPPPAGTSDGP